MSAPKTRAPADAGLKPRATSDGDLRDAVAGLKARATTALRHAIAGLKARATAPRYMWARTTGHSARELPARVWSPGRPLYSGSAGCARRYTSRSHTGSRA